MATLIAGWIGQTWGYNVAFGIAGFGKLISLVTFLIGMRWLGDNGKPPQGEHAVRLPGRIRPVVPVLVGMVGRAWSPPSCCATRRRRAR